MRSACSKKRASGGSWSNSSGRSASLSDMPCTSAHMYSALSSCRCSLPSVSHTFFSTVSMNSMSDFSCARRFSHSATAALSSSQVAK